MSEANDPNLGGFIGSSEDEGWQCTDFNLLEYVGADDSSFDIEQDRDGMGPHDEDDDTMREKDRYYSTLQYNNVVLTNDQFVDNYSNAPTYEQAQMTYYPENTYVHNTIDNPLLPSTSKNSAIIMPVKVEHEYEDETYSNVNEGSEASFNSGSRVIPRKYRIKPDSEKKNPQYRAKREKNNDAVRRSRDKAKREQERKDNRLHDLENKNIKNEHLVKTLNARVAFLEKELVNMKRNCTCRMSRWRD